MGIRENIVDLRKRYELTQDELAKIAGVSRGAVSQWEGGFSEPRMGAIQRIADHFGIKKSDIIEDTPTPDPGFDRLARNYRSMAPEGRAALVATSDALARQFAQTRKSGGGTRRLAHAASLATRATTDGVRSWHGSARRSAASPGSARGSTAFGGCRTPRVAGCA